MAGQTLLAPVLLSLPLAAAAAAQAAAGLSDEDARLVASLHLPTERRVLDNGMVLVAHRDGRAPLVATHLQVAGGAALDLSPPAGLPPAPGVAHLLEHLSYAGSPGAPDGGYDRLLSAVGVENNAWTQHDAVAFHAVGPVEALDRLLFLEADRMGGLDPDSVARRLDVERSVVARERAIDEDSPGGLDRAALRAALYPPGHPWRHPVLGDAVALAALDVDAALAWQQRIVAPERAVLVVVGDAEPGVLLDRAARWFAPLPAGVPVAAGAAAEDEVPPALPAARSGRFLHTDDVGGTTLWVAWPAPPLGAPDAAALALTVDLLALTGPLQRAEGRGRIERLQASSTFVPSLGVVRLRLASRGGPAARLERRLDRALARLARRAPAAAALRQVQDRWRTWAVRATQDPAARAELLATCQRETGQPDCLPDHVAAHLAVTPADVQRVARDWLTDDRRVSLSVVAPGRTAWALAGSLPVEGEGDGAGEGSDAGEGGP